MASPAAVSNFNTLGNCGSSVTANSASRMTKNHPAALRRAPLQTTATPLRPILPITHIPPPPWGGMNVIEFCICIGRIAAFASPGHPAKVSTAKQRHHRITNPLTECA